MNGFTKIIAWIAIIVLGWFGVKWTLKAAFGTLGLALNAVAVMFTIAVALLIWYVVRAIYRKVQ